MMKALTAPTENLANELLAQLGRGFGWLRAKGERLRRVEEIFDRLGRSAEAATLLYTIHGFESSEPRVVTAATRAAARLLDLMPLQDWPELDWRLRNHWRTVASSVPSATAAKWIVNQLPSGKKHQVTVLTLMACHHSGYVREQAIKQLADLAAIESLPVLVLRLDDWVSAVRSSAEEAWSRLAVLENVEIIAQALPLIYRYAAHDRVDGGRIQRRLSRLFATPEGQKLLLTNLGHPQARIARSSLKAILELDVKPEGWLTLALESPDQSLRLWAARTWVNDASTFAEHFDRLAADRYAPMAHLALDLCEEFTPERLEMLTKNGLLAPAVSVRRRCQEILVLDMDLDPVVLYHQYIEVPDLSATQKASLLLGLAETGGPQERVIFEAHVEDLAPRPRAAAVSGLARLAKPDEAQRFFDWLLDPSPRVARAAARPLTKLGWTSKQLTACFARARHSHGRRAALDLSVYLSIWERLIFLFDVLGAREPGDRDPEGRDPEDHVHASRLLTRTLFDGRGWAHGRPTPEQRRRLEALLLEHQAEEAKLTRQLRFLLRLSRP